ncbi:MAG: CvpA family protein [Clostridiales Family XIII bacterium]|jgi:uncharacterized membrane protein required for colicin V production|nr:CvpA family protein [Clostridiales Family XIII bacterium]
MPIDIAIIVIIAVFTILGFKNGFVYTLFFVMGWFIAIATAFFTRHLVRGFLTDSTPVYDWYHGHVYDVCLGFAKGYTDTLAGKLPGGLGEAVTAMGDQAAQGAANEIAAASFGVLSFIATVLAVKLLLFLITLALSRKYRGGFVGAVDAFFGIFLGIAQGFIVVFILLILLLPVTLAINPGLFEQVRGAMDKSFIAQTLFLNNPLIGLVDGFAPGLFDPAEWLDKIVRK